MVKNLPANAEDLRGLVGSLCREGPWRRKWQPTPGFLPRESHGQRTLAGCCPWGRKESDTTEQARARTHTHTHTCCDTCIFTY